MIVPAMIRRAIPGAALLLAVVLAGTLAACNSSTGVSSRQVVQFSLVAIDSEPLPQETMRSGDGTVTTTLTDLVLTVGEDLTWQTLGHQTVRTNGAADEQTTRASGTYTPADSGVTFRNANGDVIWLGTFTSVPPKFDLFDAQSRLYTFCRADFDAAQCTPPPPGTPETAKRQAIRVGFDTLTAEPSARNAESGGAASVRANSIP